MQKIQKVQKVLKSAKKWQKYSIVFVQSRDSVSPVSRGFSLNVRDIQTFKATGDNCVSTIDWKNIRKIGKAKQGLHTEKVVEKIFQPFTRFAVHTKQQENYQKKISIKKII